MLWKRGRQWSHQHFLAESTKMTQWMVSCFLRNSHLKMKEENLSGKERYRSKGKWGKLGCFIAAFLGIPAEDIFNYIVAEYPLNCLAFAHFNDSEKHQEGRNVVIMLHVFHVDLGTIYTFEMELAMERWEKKHDVVYRVQRHLHYVLTITWHDLTVWFYNQIRYMFLVIPCCLLAPLTEWARFVQNDQWNNIAIWQIRH